MDLIEEEQITNTIELKYGLLKKQIESGIIENNETNQEILHLVENAKKNGISDVEAKLLLDDLNLALE